MIFLIFFALIGCEAPKIDKEAPEINVLEKNKKFIINLPEDHRDGSNWQIQSGYNNSVIQRTGDVWHGNEKGIYFNFKTQSVGQATIHLLKRKYTDTLDNKYFIIKVEEK
jgi:hypothetical protein